MVVLCDGMIRSGSTWSFNAALELVRFVQPNRRVFGFYNENPAVLFAASRPRFSNLVIKSHVLDQSAYELCRVGAIKAIYTWRDPCDVVVSSMRMFGHSAEHWIGALRNALRVWSFHRATGTACIVSYESIIRAPLASVQSIACHLGVRIEPQQMGRIANAISLEQLKSFSQHVDDLEQARVVRKNHIRDGGFGFGAKLLDSEHLSKIDTLLREEGFDFLCAPRGRRPPIPQTDPKPLGVME
jgi:hypothetical protein